MAHLRRSTKIVATLGPASSTVEQVTELLQAGADVVRLNFSHGSRDSHQAALHAVRAASESVDRPVAILGDLCGPKIRLLEVAGAGVEIQAGDRLHIQRDPIVGHGDRIATNQPSMIDDVEVSHRVLIDDGAIRMRVVEKRPSEIVCVCDVGGCLRSRKGVNLPDTDLRIPTLTEKDFDDLDWAVKQRLDFVALSFVRSASDVDSLRRHLSSRGADLHVVAKIETPQAVRDIDDIIAASDAVLVARGDLGVELDLEHVPLVQKDVADRCRRAGKPVIIATQMLQSMVDAATPTRAEVSDVANAIIDCTDAVMLSAETAVGRHPVEAVRTMHRIAAVTEQYDQDRQPVVGIDDSLTGVTASVARSIGRIALESGAKAVALWTERGNLARLVGKDRLDVPVLALTPSDVVRRRLALTYGVIAIVADKPDDLTRRISDADRILLERGWVSDGDLIVIGFGARTLDCGATGSICIHVVAGPGTDRTDA